MPKVVNPNPASVPMQKYARALLHRRGIKYITVGNKKMTVAAFLKTQSWDEVSALLDKMTRKPIDITVPRPAPRPVEEI
jgi:hypothetical protein